MFGHKRIANVCLLLVFILLQVAQHGRCMKRNRVSDVSAPPLVESERPARRSRRSRERPSYVSPPLPSIADVLQSAAETSHTLPPLRDSFSYDSEVTHSKAPKSLDTSGAYVSSDEEEREDELFTEDSPLAMAMFQFIKSFATPSYSNGLVSIYGLPGAYGNGPAFYFEDKICAGRPMILKVYDLRDESRAEILREECMDESNILSSLSTKGLRFVPESPFLVDCPNAKKIILAQFLIPGRTLEHYLTRMRASPSSLFLKLFMVKLMNVVDQVHEAGYVHLDLKPNNIMIHFYPRTSILSLDDAVRDEDFDVYLIDFNRSQHIDNLGDIVESGGAYVYGAPEIMAAEYHADRLPADVIASRGPKIDVWSMGIIFLRLMTGVMPRQLVDHAHDSFQRQVISEATFDACKILFFKALASLPVPMHPARFKDAQGRMQFDLYHFVHSMLQIYPKHRASIDALFKHPYLNTVDLEYDFKDEAMIDERIKRNGGLPPPPIRQVLRLILGVGPNPAAPSIILYGLPARIDRGSEVDDFYLPPQVPIVYL